MSNGEVRRFEPEKMTEPFVDDDYENRGGYDPDFLGIEVPMPEVADQTVVAELIDTGGHVIPYEHFSVVVHAARRLALFTASNIDGRKEAKRPEEGPDYTRRGLSGLGENDREKWVIDPRIEASAQLPDRFYTDDRGNFDKGHIVRRDDVAWGADYDEVRRANGDTYHVTNCSPQVDAFNRSNKRGDWGRLENHVLKAAKAEKLCVFSGPVLDDENDKVFTGKDDDGPVEVQIPARFWKVVIAREGGELRAFAFLLEQDLSASEVEFDLTTEWATKLISVEALEDLVPDLVFPAAVRDADQFAEVRGEEIQDAASLERQPTAAPPVPPGPPPTAWDDATSPALLKEALERRDHARAGALLDLLCDDLDGTGRLVEADAAKSVLRSLRQFTWFEQLKRMASKFDEHAQDDVQVLIQLAHAQIELGELTAAVELLLDLEGRVTDDLEGDPDSDVDRDRLQWELGEILGLLGRTYKQFYVDARPSSVEPRAHDLDRSLGFYGRAFDEELGDALWHGINYVALLTHRERVARGRPNAISREASRRARQILDAIAAKDELSSWDFANRIEANLARGKTREAIAATSEYLDRADAFNVLSTRRQLLEVWMLREDKPPGTQILPLMNARFAELGGTPEQIELDPGKAALYERVWNNTRYKSVGWLQTALARANAVARIGPNKYDGDGTGFLFDGRWVSDEWAGRPLLLTNAHVCSNQTEVQKQYPYPSAPEALTATFLGAGGASEAEEIRITGLVWTSPPSELDATLLELESVPEGCTPPPRAGRTPPVTLKGDARLNILGHPKGLDLRISLQDNKTVNVGERYVHYKTPTDPGSSGSPVFNQRWELVALHHAASSEREANEGIRIDVIIDAIRASLVGGGS